MENLNRPVPTADGSHTLLSDRFGQSYHSVHGALAESRRVFLELGFEFVADHPNPRKGSETLAGLASPDRLNVLEMGFGTGLNALLTWLEADRRALPVRYTTLEAYPISSTDLSALNYDAVLHTDRLRHLHAAPWGEDVPLGEFFTIRKERTTLEKFLGMPEPDSASLSGRFKPPAEGSRIRLGNNDVDLVYFDAFSPDTQPELWTAEVFTGLAKKMAPNGVLTTYSAKGSVRRALQAAGFRVEKHPGPPGKREVVRAVLSANGGFL
jgi:tRNA U34 5-methylaminomethyl-2-thiouridine-forming methyltransferase MnmC